MSDDAWRCPNCGSPDPHAAMTFPRPDDERFDGFDIDPEPEFEVDVTCESVYITPVGGGDGFAFTHAEFEQTIEHFREATNATE